MSETWDLLDVDTETRDRAVREAARLGVPLSTYLGDILLQKALGERPQAPSLAPEQHDEAPLSPGAGFAIRHQIKTLERHLGASVSTLDGALDALDGSLLGLGGRLNELEAQAGHTAKALAQQVKDLHDGLDGLRAGLADVESAAKSSGHDNERVHATLAEACGELEQRLEGVEAIARGAESAAAQLAHAQQAYRRSFAQDLDTLSRETAAHVTAGLDQVRAAADDAAAHADAAAAHLISELRSLRQSIDDRLAESAAETKQRMHAAFAENAQRIAGFADRVSAGERQSERHAEHVRAQIANVEDGVQTAIEETALTLRRADAVLAADIVKVAEGSRVAMDALRADVTADAATLRERQLNTSTRLANAEVKLAAASDQAVALGETMDRRLAAADATLREALDQVDAALSDQFDTAASRATELEQDIAHVRRSLGAEITRVEECTLAALEKQARDRGAGETAVRRSIDEQASSTRAAVDDMRRRVEEQIAVLQGQQTNVQTRLDVVDAALANDGPLASVVSATAEEVASLRTRVLGAQTAERSNAERIGKLESNDAENVRAFENLQRRIEGVAAQLPPDHGERVHDLERSVADLRLHQLASDASAADDPRAEAVAAIQSQLADLEERQAEALHRLRNDISHFIGENERRLALLEEAEPDLAAPFAALERRLAEVEQHDVGVAFAELRARIEERVLGVEQRNVRTLEQLSDTVALIERRFNAEDEARASRSA